MIKRTDWNKYLKNPVRQKDYQIPVPQAKGYKYDDTFSTYSEALKRARYLDKIYEDVLLQRMQYSTGVVKLEGSPSPIAFTSKNQTVYTVFYKNKRKKSKKRK